MCEKQTFLHILVHTKWFRQTFCFTERYTWTHLSLFCTQTFVRNKCQTKSLDSSLIKSINNKVLNVYLLFSSSLFVEVISFPPLEFFITCLCFHMCLWLRERERMGERERRFFQSICLVLKCYFSTVKQIIYEICCGSTIYWVHMK